MIKEIKIIDEVLKFAWELSQNELYASYPRMDSFETVREQLKRAIESDDRKLIGYFNQGVLTGLCFYFWISDDRYVQTAGFLIKENYDQVADEFINYMAEQLPGYELLIGMPSTNRQAREYFEKKKIPTVEESIVTIINNLTAHEVQHKDCVIEIDRDNFEDYGAFHDKYAISNEMYWTSVNLLNNLDRFRIYAFQDGDAIRGSIFVNANEEESDIVGLFVDEKYKHRGIEKVLINEMLAGLYNEFGPVREILFFIDEHSFHDLQIALEMGFRVKEKYRLYKCTLQ